VNRESNPLQLEIKRRDLFRAATAIGIGVLTAATYEDTYQTGKAFAGTTNANLLQNSPNEFIEGLGNLEALSGGRDLFSGVMQFMDVSAAEADSWQATSLQQAVNANLFTFSILDLDNLDLSQPQTEQPVINDYFSALFSNLDLMGIDPADIGPFVLCPEFVVGFQGPPSEYADYLNLFLEEINQVAPTAQTTNMIDLGETNDLLPLLSNVNQELLDSVGIQAFADSDKITFNEHGRADVSGYITAAQIEAIVGALGNKPMWLNTGIIRRDETIGLNGVSYSLKQRVAIANAVADVVATLISHGVNVFAVNLFAENKLNGRDPSQNAERRDFSFHPGTKKHPGDEEILITFANRMKALGVELSGYAIPEDILGAS
jgi:hypothetical protein